jgi:hypothetical protein
MAFTLNTRKEDDIVVIDMSGQLSAGDPQPNASEAIQPQQEIRPN